MDTIVPYSNVYCDDSDIYHSALIDYNIINMDCCSLKELPKRICGGSDDDGCYGRFTINKKSNYLLPSLLAVHVRKNASPYNDVSAYDALLPFVDRYLQETDDSCAIRSSAVLLYGDQLELPSWLKTYCYIVEEPYPQGEEIAAIIQNKISQSNCVLSDDTLNHMYPGFWGIP